MPKLDLTAIPRTNATGYPDPFDHAVAGRWYRRLAPPSGLTNMGVSHVTLEPGAWSSQRHWHAVEDEFVVILSGEAVLVDDDGETVMRAGDCASFPAGERNGHHLQNRTDRDCVFIAVSAGDDATDRGDYPDIDLQFTPEGYEHKDGTPYPTTRLP
ncbi:MAG: cupin domain-containing protein [Sphingomonas sp.]|uniref:cupin domain-containing protein n=1 Tax=Sphingomonas sp. TaxID=28214 RepID=UPI001AC3EC05|nr:cupin domain-containing protein [Sphingomonas sp.]MBN8807133.1 cupin domain-containing protein [Sphingomonas sp.]